jgi:chromosome segregation ATPase
MAPQPYNGPTALAYSKYASPHMHRAQLASLPLVVSSANSSPTRTTIATKEQIAATHHESTADMMAQDADAELAFAQGNSLKDEVEKHSAKFARTVSTTMTNTRKLLNLIREALNKYDAPALETVEELWAELEQHFDAARQSKDALPSFMEKQRNNMALYHATVVNETYRESQEELNMQHKKVNLQHGLILEHQQAFQDYKEKTASKLKELEDLQERVSRLTLEKGNFRGEIDKYTRLLEQEQSIKADELKKVADLHKELETLVASKKQLQEETEALRKTTGDLEETTVAAEQKLADRYTAELKAKDDQLGREATRIMSLNTLINSLKQDEGNNKKGVEKLRVELNNLSEKYTRMGAEHAKAFAVSCRWTE